MNDNDKKVSINIIDEMKTSFFIKITWIIALPCFLVFLIFSVDIINILYSKGLSDLVIDEFTFSYKLLMISSVSILYYAFLQTFTSILQSVNKPIVPFVSMFVALLFRTAGIFVFVSIPSINIFGVAISNLIFLSVATIINLIYIKKYVALKFDFVKILISPTASALISGVVMYFLRMSLINLNVWVYLIISAGVGLICYLTLIFMFKTFNSNEMKVFNKKNIIGNKTKQV